MTFDDVASEADQQFEMHMDTTGSLEYVTKYVELSEIFSNTTNLTLLFSIFRPLN